MKLEFWSDIICPYCGLMDNRLRLALERFEHADDVQVVHRSFQVHPGLPREGVTQRQLLELHGISPARAEQLLAPIEAAAHAEGLETYHVLERTLGPTDHAHELLAFATDKGRGNEVWTAMFHAHFGSARNLWTQDQVLDFAAELGLDREETDRVLRERRYRAQVVADQREAERLGAHGTPFITLDATYAIPGAVGTDELLAAMTTAWKAAHPEPQPMQILGQAGGACAQDGCAVASRHPTP